MIDDDAKKQADDRNLPSVHRARNRTVVLSPDITGHVRAKLASDNIELDDGSGFVRMTKNQSKLQLPENPTIPDQYNNEHNYNPSAEEFPLEDSVGSSFEQTFENIESEQPSKLNDINNDLSNDAPRIEPSPVLLPTSNEHSSTRNPLNQLSSFKSGSRPFEYPDLKSTLNTSGFANGEDKLAKAFSYVASQAATSNNVTQVVRLSNPKQIIAETSLLVGFLVSYDKLPSGEAYELREGRNIVSRDLPPNGGKVIILEDENVSSMHAILKVDEDGSVTVLDQLSESGTFINRTDGSEIKLEGDRARLQHGDILKFGCRSFKVCLIYN
jgi:FHA domain